MKFVSKLADPNISVLLSPLKMLTMSVLNILVIVTVIVSDILSMNVSISDLYLDPLL